MLDPPPPTVDARVGVVGLLGPEVLEEVREPGMLGVLEVDVRLAE